ncbi:MAG: caspase family protein [Flavobacteriales bacterium]|nr:caspase family protein [Flavobacteriales bacterium]
MNEHDYAIVVGIHNYPGDQMTHLKGTLNDARDFKEWLTSSSGGGLPESNIQTIIKEFTPEDLEGLDVLDAVPTQEDIKREFLKLNRKAKKAMTYEQDEDLTENGIAFYRDPDDNKRYYGRRLYLFFAGHGFNKRDNVNSVSLIAANGDYQDLINNGVDAFNCLEFYENAGYFKEAILVTDCCRLFKSGSDGNQILQPDPANPPRVVRTAYFLSCQNGQKAREREFDGKCNGIFSKMLLEAFNNANYDHATNAVHYKHINEYILSNNEQFSGGQIPQIHGNSFGHEIKITFRNQDHTGAIRFKVPENWIGGTLSIIELANNQPVKTIELHDAQFEESVPIGIYRYQITKGASTKDGFFEITSAMNICDFEAIFNNTIL